MPKISVIVPVYNAEIYISRCIESIINQTFQDIEIILINDGSNDNSINILREYEKKDNRIRVIDKQNEGVSETRNLGIREAAGQYIQFIDSDDFIEKNMLEESIIEIEKNTSDLIISGIYLDIEKGGKVQSTIQTFDDLVCNDKKGIAAAVLERLNGTYINSPVNKLYKKSIIVDNNIIMDRNIDLGEDLLFNIEYLSFCKSVVFKKKGYYHYWMQDGENLTYKFREDKLDLMKLLYDNCLDYFKRSYLSEQELIELNNIFIKWMYSCFIDLNNPKCKLTLKRKLIFIKESVDKFDDIISNTNFKSKFYVILKFLLKMPLLVLLISKIMFIIKTSFRKILYR